MTKQNRTTQGRNGHLRPTLIIGLGGTGHNVSVQVKSLVHRRWSAEQIAQHVKFQVFDTAREELVIRHNGRAVTLEPDTEFHDIGQTPVANIKRNLARQAAIRERLGGVIANLPPTVLRNGAKQLRPLGLLAFLWRYADIEEHLRNAIWDLAGREHSRGREGVNVFIVNSLVGGTGSSTFLDVAHIVRDLFDELGTLADFCYITGVGVLPRAFHGITGPNIIPNSVASLKELNHCMMRGDFKTRYPNGRVVQTGQPPFNVYYLVDGIDERGHTWNGPGDVYRLAAEAIFLQMGSQVGQKHENDFDNLDEVLVQQTDEGDGTFYGSFGLASLVFPGPAVARACATRQAVRVIETALLAAPAETTPESAPKGVADFLESAGLMPAQLGEALACDDQGLPAAVELGAPGWTARLSAQALPGELVRYVRDYEKTRLGNDFKRWLRQNEGPLAAQGIDRLTRHITRLSRQAGLPATEPFLTQTLARLDAVTGKLSDRQVERESRQVALGQELGHLETAFLQAGESGFLGRGRRVAKAQHTYLTAAQHLFELRWQNQVTAATLTVLGQVYRVAQDALAAGQAVTARLKAAQTLLQNKSRANDTDLSLAGVTTQSLAKEPLVSRLFERHAPPVADVVAALFNEQDSPLDWHEAAAAEIEAALLAACEPAFAPIAAMSVDAAIAAMEAETSPESYYAWLMSQATPSWNLDRARLPDGGNDLQRLEVLGVPDETQSVFSRHAAALVSTGDPARITAFVAHIGAPHSGIQQWDSYRATYDQIRGHVPLHILPQFQSDNEQARQTFALGSLFGFIYSHGAYFYYKPADHLDRPVKLAQGLENSLKAFTGKDELVQATRERIDQVVATRGVNAVLDVLSRYYDAPPGRQPADELILELKRLVRAYADELRQIHQFAAPSFRPADEEPANGNTPTELHPVS